ncbi:MAG TPA: hypothetical protein ENN43_00670, partial [bacterium]|nr:hypothetical protein [bacterium]
MSLLQKVKRTAQQASDTAASLYKKNPAVFTVASVFIFFSGIAAIYASVELTSTPEFCSSCHIMEQAHASWTESVHYNVPEGEKRAACRDCHLPPWNRPVELLWSKAYHGIKDVAKNFLEKEEMKYPGYYFNMKSNRVLKNSYKNNFHGGIIVKTNMEVNKECAEMKKNREKCSAI